MHFASQYEKSCNKIFWVSVNSPLIIYLFIRRERRAHPVA